MMGAWSSHFEDVQYGMDHSASESKDSKQQIGARNRKGWLEVLCWASNSLVAAFISKGCVSFGDLILYFPWALVLVIGDMFGDQ